jgi:DNA-binding LytR/AlgR family response regulator
LFDERHPDICLLDVHMPGLSGVDAANHIGRRAHLVFVTAYDHYAVQAFAQGALDYLLKPVERARLAETVSRLKERLQSSRPAINTEQLLQQLSEQLAKLQSGGGRSEALRWIRAQAGKTVRLIAIDDVDYLRSDAKYTIVAWRDGGKPAEAVVRTPLKELLEQLDAEQFAQVHRSVVVNLRAISHVKRHDNETAAIHVRGRDDVLPVSAQLPACVPADVAAVRPPESALRRKLVVRAHARRHSVGAHVERRPHGRWADRRRCASSDSTSAESNTGSIE